MYTDIYCIRIFSWTELSGPRAAVATPGQISHKCVSKSSTPMLKSIQYTGIFLSDNILHSRWPNSNTNTYKFHVYAHWDSWRCLNITCNLLTVVKIHFNKTSSTKKVTNSPCTWIPYPARSHFLRFTVHATHVHYTSTIG